MNPPLGPQPRQRRDSVRHQAHLDAETHAELEELAASFHRKRGPILRHVMEWGLTQTQQWAIDRSIAAAVPSVPVLLAPELLQQVQYAAAAHGVSVATGLRHALHQIAPDDFPASWRAGKTAGRSHE